MSNGPINRQLANEYDGPYVFYDKSSIIVKSIDISDGKKILREENIPLAEKEKAVLTVHTDEPGKTFSVQLKKELKLEPCEYEKPGKLLILSDIEGNFYAFRKLLQANHVIDDNYNWIFGNGHLVLLGDFFDNGKQVTECLWLSYYLEEKSIVQGGYVHFVLGNHELMNMSGDLRYVQPKYLDNCTKLLHERYSSLYNDKTELGRWLRTKNIIEKSGDLIFVHGGFHEDVNKLSLSITAMNAVVRKQYGTTDDYQSTDFPSAEKTLYYNKTAPFWYRGYYKGDRTAMQAQVDNTLKKFDVSRIITGHTIIADTVSSWYIGKVIDVDTHHAGGKSEALFIEGDNYYRVNGEGEKKLLLSEPAHL
jgi:hypothetical protein